MLRVQFSFDMLHYILGVTNNSYIYIYIYIRTYLLTLIFAFIDSTFHALGSLSNQHTDVLTTVLRILPRGHQINVCSFGPQSYLILNYTKQVEQFDQTIRMHIGFLMLLT